MSKIKVKKNKAVISIPKGNHCKKCFFLRESDGDISIDNFGQRCLHLCELYNSYLQTDDNYKKTKVIKHLYCVKKSY